MPQDRGHHTKNPPDCFLPGTLILTEHGEIAIERLRIGDVVITWGGRKKPVTWLCWGKTPTTAPTADPTVILRRNALADGVPYHDLHVTPEHKLLIEGRLIAADALINGRSVVHAPPAGAVEYFHVEVEPHDVLVANGAPAESYRPDHRRTLLLAGHGNSSSWATAPPPCAPIVTHGPEAARRWRLVSERAGLSGALVYEPDLHLLADGHRVPLQKRRPDNWGATLPRRPGLLRLRSRAAVPAHLGAEFDHRALGVQVRRVILAQEGVELRLDAAARFLRDGFHPPDPAGRWTDGNALLPLDALTGLTGPLAIEIEITAYAPTARVALTRDPAELTSNLVTD